MTVLCLYIPRLPVRLAERTRPALAGKPVVVVSSPGAEGLVVASSPAASAHGVAPGMTATDARRIVPGATFLPDNAAQCLDELERLASILQRRATPHVELGGRDHLFLALPSESDPGLAAESLRRLATAWLPGMEVRAGVACTRRDALQAARKARSFPIVLPGDAPDEPPVRDRTHAALAASAALSGSGVARRATVSRLAARLGTVLAARAESFRELTLAYTTPTGETAHRATLRPASDVLAAVSAALDEDLLAGGTNFQVRLSRLGPDLAVSRYCGGREVRPGRLHRSRPAASPSPLPMLAAG